MLPKFHETFLPILATLSPIDCCHYRELAYLVREHYYAQLSQELLNITLSSGDNALFNRISWGKSYLKMGRFIDYPKRGFVQITQKGRDALSRGHLTIEDLKKDQDYLLHQRKQNAPSINLSEYEQLSENLSPHDLIDEGFSSIERTIKKDLLERLQEINPYYFEKVILILLKTMGYGDFTETKRSRDGGIDGIINEDKLGLEKIYIQTKRYHEDYKVREPDIRDFIGAMSGDTHKGIFVTTSSFDDSAQQKALNAHHKIILIDGKKLVDLMYEYGVGVQIAQTYHVKKVDEDFFFDD
jgi:restriction system protein